MISESNTTAPPRAVILCGGKGTRLRPYTTVLPKPLMPIGNRPILEVVLNSLKKAGIVNVTLCVGHLAELIRAFFGDGEKLGLNIEYSMEDKPLGTIGPLAFIENLGENFLVMNGDVLTDLNPMTLFEAHLAKGCDLTVATHEREAKIDFGVLSVREGCDEVQGFVEKPCHRYEVSMGVYAMNRSVLEHFARGEAFGFDQLVLTLLAKKRSVHRMRHDGVWFDIGRLEDYDLAQSDPRWGGEQ